MGNSVPLRQWYIDHKICVACGQRDAFNGRQKCPECLEKATLSNIKYRSLERERSYYTRRKAKREDRISQGLCPNCGKPAVKGQLCLEHYVKSRKRREVEKQYRMQRGDPRRIRVENGKCWFCESPAIDGMHVCELHYKKTIEKFRCKRGGTDHPWVKDETIRIEQIRMMEE